MTAALPRNYRMRSQFYAAFAENGLPSRNELHNYFQHHGLPGGSRKYFTAFHSSERPEQPVPVEFARGLILFIKGGGRHGGPWAGTPNAVRQLIQSNDDEQLLDVLFEKVPPSEIPRKPTEPSERNDDAIQGLKYYVTCASHAIVRYLLPRIQYEPESVFFDRDGGPTEYARLFHTEVGYQEKSQYEELSIKQAHQRGLEYANEPAGLIERHAARLLDINRDCIRCCLDADGTPVGFSAAHAITDEAYERVVAGERRCFYYEDDEILPCGNNIQIDFIGAIHDAETPIKASKRHRLMHAGLMLQLALLLDPKSSGPVRFVSQNVISANAMRTKKFGFQDLHTFEEPGKPVITTCEFNPDKRGRRGIVPNTLMRLVIASMWVIRNAIDEHTENKASASESD